MERYLKTVTRTNDGNDELIAKFTFKDEAQFLSWERELQKWKRSGSSGYSIFFLDSDGILQYQKMVSTINQAIDIGCMSLSDYMCRQNIS